MKLLVRHEVCVSAVQNNKRNYYILEPNFKILDNGRVPRCNYKKDFSNIFINLKITVQITRVLLQSY